MLTRVLTAVVALAVFVGILLLPPVCFNIALAAVIIMMLYECYKATKADCAMKIIGFLSAVMLMAVMYWVDSLDDITMIFVFMAATVVILLHMALVVFRHGKRSYKEILTNGFLTMYITVAMWCIVFAKNFMGTSVMLLIFICAWSCDTFAYFSGRLFGKRKLIPHVSPNKTVAGAVGGVIGAAVMCGVYAAIVDKIPNVSIMGIPAAMIIGIIGGICSQLGDLIASSIKRDEDIKDFGWIFPGHGGFMDRFDSVMFISPIILMMIVSITFFVFIG